MKSAETCAHICHMTGPHSSYLRRVYNNTHLPNLCVIKSAAEMITVSERNKCIGLLKRNYYKTTVDQIIYFCIINTKIYISSL